MMEWQPIETAPNDGARILAWVHWRDGGNAHSGVFEDGEFVPDFRGSACIAPSHWMPLPEAPKPKDMP